MNAVQKSVAKRSEKKSRKQAVISGIALLLSTFAVAVLTALREPGVLDQVLDTIGAKALGFLAIPVLHYLIAAALDYFQHKP